MAFKDKVVVITGSASGIGKACRKAFEKQGALVCGIDLKPGEYYQGDIGRKEVLEDFVRNVLEQYGHVDIILNNALPLRTGLKDGSYEDFMQALAVGVAAPFYLTKLLQNHLGKDASIINISSTRQFMSQAQSESYAAAKGGIGALSHAMAVSLAGIARVNAISPGWIDTGWIRYAGPDAVQQPCGRVGNPDDIASLVLYLCSEKAGFIDGENIRVDGGMSRLMIYHGDEGWSYNPNDE